MVIKATKIKWTKKMQKSLDQLMQNLQTTKQLLQGRKTLKT